MRLSKYSKIGLLALAGWLLVSSLALAIGTWTPVAHTAPSSVGLMMLLPDGTVMAQNNGGTAWYRLTPDSAGHYANGTWTTLQPMHDSRLYCGTQVLKDGRLFVAGGEYGNGRSTGEVYDPLTNRWKMAPPSGHAFVDSNSEILADGRVLIALVESTLRNTLIFDPVANTWTAGPTANGIHNESAWVKLPDDSLLFVDRLTTNSERYIPASNTWITDATVPVSLYDPYGDETGPGLLLPNGKVIYFGATGHTAIYTPSGSTANGTWVAGPDFPNAQGTPDAPAAMLPNGKILCAVCPIPISGNVFQSPTTFYEYDYMTNSFTSVPTTTGGTLNHSSYYGTMLVLPDGTALYNDFSSQLYNYHPDGTPVAAGKPVISSVTQNADGSYHLTGTQLNGISEGSCYGDDNQNATNYPIVSLTSGGNVYYARSYNWSRTSVATGNTPVTTEFALPATLPAGTYNLAVVANGIASDPVVMSFAPIVISLPASATEGAAPVTATVTLPSAAVADTMVTLVSSDPARATVPASVTVPLGQSSTTFQVTIIDDAIMNGAEAVAISASAAGLPTGRAIISILDNESAVLSVTPSTSLSSSGFVGGPFSVTSVIYTLNNTGNMPLNWTMAKAASWLTLSASSGTLAGGANTTVTVSLSASANTLPAGTVTDTINIFNLTTGDGDTTRSASLTVQAGTPAMSVSPAAVTASGGVGGPFGVTSSAMSVSNTGTGSMSWNVTKTASWLTISPASGSVAAGASTPLTVTINSNANVLAQGSYSDTLTFTNSSNGNGNTTVPVSLLVQPVVQSYTLTTNPGWTTQGQWAYGQPTGGGGTLHGNHDPSTGFTGSNVFGVNLSGDYSTTVGGPYYLIAGPLNFTGNARSKVAFRRWLNTDVQPQAYATLEVSNDGSNWTTVYSNGATAVNDAAWTAVQYDISAVADNQSAVYLRWGYQIASGALAESGWNIDDVSVIATPGILVPTAAAQSVAAAFGTGTAITLTGTDTNTPAQALTFAIASSPLHGALSGTAPNVTYRPTPGYNGADSFTFTTTNSYGLASAPATVTLTVAAGVPTADTIGINVSTNGSKAVTLSGTDPNLPPLPLSFAVVAGPTQGTLSGTAPNLTYTPAASYTGPDSFTYTASNGSQTSVAATVSIVVGVVNVAEPVIPVTVTGGNIPRSTQILGSDGLLYGTTQAGGSSGLGAVYKITTAGVMTTLANFHGYDGATPQGGLCLGADGNFYGTTTLGGANNLGTIFRMSPGGVLTTLVSCSTANGTTPRAALVQASDGNFYGTTTGGGISFNGTIFRMSPAGVFTVLGNFSGTSGSFLGSNCQAAMIQGNDATTNLYGVTGGGGANSAGTLFKLTTGGVFTTLVTFTGTSGAALGSTPLGALVQAADTTLYGTTSTSGASANGTIFKCTTTGTLTTLQSFTGSSGLVLGGNSNAPMVIGSDGLLYGTTATGGTINNGSLFKISTTGTFTSILSIGSGTGTNTGPYGGLVLAGDGNFYSTLSSLSSWSLGTRGAFFRLTPGTTNTFTLLLNFPQLPPVYRHLLRHSDGNFYGTSYQGGTSQWGGVFKLTPGGAFTTLTSFTSAITPSSLMVGSDGNLYGTCDFGGPSGVGIIYKLTTSGTLTTLANLTGNTGAFLGGNPLATLTEASPGVFYGTTSAGGASGFGVVFTVTSSGTYTVLASFTGTTGALPGSVPETRLVSGGDGNLYGATAGGGAGGFGTLFRVNISSGVVSSLASFTGTTGGLPGTSPATDLVLATDGSLYGTTTSGGLNSAGSLYRLTTGGTATSLVSFTGNGGVATGSSPISGLVVGADHNLYGTTSNGGVNGLGSVYRWTLAGAFTSLASFTNAAGALPGSQPSGMLYQAADGWFYGSCNFGGLYNIGTVYRFHPSGLAQTLYTFGTNADGGSPNQAGVTVNSIGYQFASGSDGYVYGGNGSTVFRVHQQPAVQSIAATSLTPNSATLASMVVPNQDGATVYYEYGYTTSYGTQTTPQVLTAGGSAVAVNAALTGLVAGTVYHYHLVTITSQGTFITADQTFATPAAPLAITGSYVGAGQNGITVDGVVNPYGSPTSYYFEYGVGPGDAGDADGAIEYLVSSTPVDIGSGEPNSGAGGGIANVPVSTTFNLLGPAGTYHIRLVATNSYGTTYGDDQIINTLPVSSGVVQPVFQNQGTGTAPQAGLVRAADGSFQGTLSTGGTFGLGAVFSVTANGTLTHQANFFGNVNGGVAGSGPQSTVVQALDGNDYGTTNAGGYNGVGTIFQMTPDGTLTTLVSFTGTNGPAVGSNPICGLTLGTDGSLYGVTQFGGSSGLGTVFKVTTAGVFTSLVSFTGTTGAALGSNPRAGLILASDGNFYGTTAAGGSGGGFGTIFKMTPAGTLTTLVNFTGTTGAALGSTPLGALVQGSDSNFYGTTNLGGANNLGTVFVISPAGALTTLVNFTGTTGTAVGSSPKGGLVQAGDGSFYGATLSGGAGGFGNLFKVAQGGVFTSLISFTGTTGTNLGTSPNGSLVLGVDGAMYGTTSAGGLNNAGSIFRFTTDGQFATLVNLNAAPVFGRPGQSSGGDLYGTTTGGGTALGYGTVYSGTPGNATQLLAPLVPTSGTTALASRGGLLLAADGNFYGTTASGGAGNLGSVFSLTPAGVLNTLVSFTSTGAVAGSSPLAQLITGSDGSLYGTTSGGGSSSGGTIFKVTLGGTFTNVINFTGTSGANLGSSPQAPLIIGSDGNYYGTTAAGGTGGGFGTVFKLTTGGTLTTLVNFTGTIGSTLGSGPVGALAQAADGSLYGVTGSGGVFGLGTVFKVTTGGVFTSVASFTGTTGALPGTTPVGGLFVGVDGCLYGVTSGGGLYNQGTLLRVAGDGTVASIYWFTGRNDGIAPAQGLFRAADGFFYGGTGTSLYRLNPPPVPLTAPATNVLATSATLNGSVIPETGAATAWFDYGQTASYGMATAPQLFNAAYTASPMTAALTGLDPFLTYHYRLTVSSSMGTFSGPDMTFATPDATVFNAATDVPVIASAFNATGLPVNVALGFAPATGTVLTLVNNTGFAPVLGTFNGLPEGAAITAMFGAQAFLLQISYVGGDGNDVTLTVVSQAITFPAIPAKLTSDVPFTLNATATSGLAVSYAIIAGSTSATLSGNQITLTGTAGTVAVQATQAGNGTYGAAMPVVRTFSVSTGSAFTQVAGSKGNDVFLGIRANGTLWGWGYGFNSQIGISAGNQTVPVQVGVATNWKSVSLGGSHTVAVRTDGTLWAWGINTLGQVGDGTTTTRSSPVQIGAGTTWALAVAGTNHTVAVKTDGTLWSWGSNSSGQLGQGTTDASTHPTPVQVGVLTNWKFTGQSLSAGGDFTLAVNSSGNLWTWGINSNGQLGNGTTTNATAPVQIGVATNWTSIAAGSNFSAGLHSDGTLWTWGLNSSGQLGDGTLIQNLVPTQVGVATSWQTLMTGGAYSMAIKTDGTLWTWGGNLYGQLGQGFNDVVARGNVPTQVGTATNWQFIAPSLNASLAVKSDGTPWTWGYNNNGELGYNERLPLPVAAQFGPVSMAAGGFAHSVALKTDGTLWAWGYNASGQLGLGSSDSGPHVAPAQLLPGTLWASASANGSSSFAVKNDGTLWAWGYNGNGELGDGTITQRNSPVQIGTTSYWLTVTAGYDHALAIRTDGTLWAWGLNASGQVGNGTTANQYTPVQVGTDTDWAAISGGSSHSVALKRNGTLWAWGYNFYGQLGDGTTTNHSLPVQVGTATTWRSISAGFYHTAATQTDGSLWAWGYNGYGQLGDGSFTNRSSPVKIGTGTTWNSLAAGGDHTEATKNDGSLWAWGNDSNNQLGDGGTTNRSSPAQVGSSTGWLAPFKGANHSLVTTVDGTLWGFGLANYGAIGFAWRNQLVPDLVLPVLSPAQTISFSVPSQVAVGNAITLAASARSGLPPSYIVSGPAMLNGSQLTVTGPGAISVIAYQAGDNYWQASDISQQYINEAAPTAITTIATSVTTTTATINGIVNPLGLPTTAKFQSGLSTAYALNTSLILSPINGYADQALSATLTGLSPGTTYHFIVSATNTFGASSGTDVTFTTLAPVIAVFDGTLAGTALSDGVSAVGFGPILPAQSATRTFTIQNTGNADLMLSMPFAMDGANAGDFVVDASKTSTTVAAGASTTFTVTCTPSATGARTAGLHIASNALGALNPFDITLGGTGLIAQTLQFDGIAQQSCGTALVLGATSSSGLGVSYAFTTGADIASLAGNSVSFSAPGTVTIQATQAGDGNYAPAAPVSQTFTVVKGSQVITFDNSVPASASYSSTVVLAATSNFGVLPVVFSVVSGPGALVGNVLSFSGPGLVTVQAGQAGNTAFNSATSQMVINAFNTPPVAADGAAIGDENTTLTGTATAVDAQGTALILAKVSNPAHGTLTFNGDGTFSFVPVRYFYGTDSFTFKTNDGYADSNIATITLTVRHVNQAPVVQDSSATGVQGNLVRGVVTGTDVEGDALTFAQVVAPAHGALTLNADGTYAYRPEADFVGTDTFTYKANDGQADSNIATVTLVIITTAPQWTWMDGPSIANVKGVYGTPGAAASANTPGARQDAATWSDGQGHFWMFGGTGYAATTGPGALNDLWTYDVAASTWTWLGGGNTINAGGIYGTQGTAAPANSPGARTGAASWIDQSGNLWLFGGTGRDSSATGTGYLNDLWMYNTTSGSWTWVGGSNLKATAVTVAPTAPEARSGAATWVDSAGCLMLFGGRALPASGTVPRLLNDLWRYDTGANAWTLLRSGNAGQGTYGVQGTGSATTQPGARADAVSWMDTQGRMWLYGGSGFATTATSGNLNDLWCYDAIANQWTWINGASSISAFGVYGTLGTTDPASHPGARSGATGWTDATGAFWLFGGTGSAASTSGLLNDVWCYQPATNTWTWMKGPSIPGIAGIYGTLGSASSANTPGARQCAMAFADAGGNLWLFGGINGTSYYSDSWRLTMPPAPVVSAMHASYAIQISPPAYGESLQASINANGLPTTGHFRYSTHPDMSGAVDTPDQILGAGTMPVQMQEFASSLANGITFYVQAVAVNAFGQGTGQILSFTTLGTAPAPVASFTSSGSTVSESAGTVSVAVQLSAPSTSAFTIPFTLGGTATATDYVAPASTLNFLPGQTLATVDLKIIDDVVHEADKTVIITLGTPTGGVTLGSTSVYTLTITDNDFAPQVSTPGSAFATVGSSITFSPTATGSGPLSYQWKKNGTAITGATSATYSLASTALTSMGNYTVQVTNPTGSITSAAAELSVIDASDHNWVLAPGATATLTVNASSPGTMTYHWYKDGAPMADVATRITGSTTKTLTIKLVTTADAADYTCTVTCTDSSLSASSGDNMLAVVSLKPAILPVDALTPGVVGGPYSYQILVDSDPLKTPSSFTVTGLPAGLTVNASGLISGRPTAAVTSKALTISATNSAGTSPLEPCTLSILPLPATVPGTFAATVARQPGVADNLGARVDITPTVAGAFTAKLTLKGLIVSTAGILTTTLDTSGASPVITAITGHVLFPRTGKSTLVLDFALDAPPNTLTGTLTDAVSSASAAVTGFRNPWNATTSKAASYKGYYTFGLDIDSGSIGDQSIPQGNGFGSFTVADDGTLTFAGRTADNVAFTTASFAGPAGQVVVFAPSATNLGSLTGTPVIVPDLINNHLAGTVSWNKGPASATSTDHAYPSGFAPLNLAVMGGKYTAPIAGAVVMGLPNNYLNARLSFFEGGLLPGQAPPVVISIRNYNSTGTTQSVSVPTAGGSANPAKVSFVLATTPLGQYSGSLTIANATPTLVRTTTYQGMIIRLGNSYQALGCFLLPQLPQPGQTLSTAPQLSGQVVLESTTP